jgi:hypothetical protein
MVVGGPRRKSGKGTKNALRAAVINYDVDETLTLGFTDDGVLKYATRDIFTSGSVWG